MGFLQIITFHTDRNTPGRYVALDWFGSYESAMVNSHLPETSASVS